MPKLTRFKATDVDKGWRELKKLALLGRSHVKVGILGAKATETHPAADASGGRVTNVDLAFIHEFGAPRAHIPARPFIRGPFDSKRFEYMMMLRRLIGSVYDMKMPVERALGIMGAKVAADMKANVMSGSGIPPPLAPSTIRRKRSLTRPGAKGGVRALIDTGRMVGALSWKVVVGGDE